MRLVPTPNPVGTVTSTMASFGALIESCALGQYWADTCRAGIYDEGCSDASGSSGSAGSLLGGPPRSRNEPGSYCELPLRVHGSICNSPCHSLGVHSERRDASRLSGHPECHGYSDDGAGARRTPVCGGP